ncbi:MAG: TIGR02588 family protein [Methylacidiphilales bacterium]|nr:TIGR02588 family protein [Candidatus Methylacidiphilales bacterium]
MNKTQESNHDEHEKKPKRTVAEWITFSISLSILASIIGLVIYTLINDKHQPPLISIIQKPTTHKINGQYSVPFEVVKQGDETAESVQIIAELKVNNRLEETGEQQIDFLSSREKEEGAFIFSHNPQQGQLKIRVASYKLP